MPLMYTSPRTRVPRQRTRVLRHSLWFFLICTRIQRLPMSSSEAVTTHWYIEMHVLLEQFTFLLLLCIKIGAACCVLKTLYHRMGKLCDQWILFYYKYLLDSDRVGTDMRGNHRFKQVPGDKCQSEVWGQMVVGSWTVAAAVIKWTQTVTWGIECSFSLLSSFYVLTVFFQPL